MNENSTHFYDADANECLPNDPNNSKVELNLVGYTCELIDEVISIDNGTIVKRRTGAYREVVQLDSTPEIEVFRMLFERC